MFSWYRRDGHLPALREEAGLLWEAWLRLLEEALHWSVRQEWLRLWLWIWLGRQITCECLLENPLILPLFLSIWNSLIGQSSSCYKSYSVVFFKLNLTELYTSFFLFYLHFDRVCFLVFLAAHSDRSHPQWHAPAAQQQRQSTTADQKPGEFINISTQQTYKSLKILWQVILVVSTCEQLPGENGCHSAPLLLHFLLSATVSDTIFP